MEPLKVAWIGNSDVDRLLPVKNESISVVAAVKTVRYQYDDYQAPYPSRTKGWLSKVWRIVRSVVVTAALGGFIGYASSDGNIGGFIIGSIVMGVVAIVDVIANDHCHFAMQCDGGWRQDCTSGDCLPY